MASFGNISRRRRCMLPSDGCAAPASSEHTRTGTSVGARGLEPTSLKLLVGTLNQMKRRGARMKGRGKWDIRRKLDNQWHCLARFSHAEIRDLPRTGYAHSTTGPLHAMQFRDFKCSGDAHVSIYHPYRSRISRPRMRKGGRGGAVIRLRAFHLGESASILGGVAPALSHAGVVLNDAALVGGFSTGSPVSPSLAFQRLFIHRYTLISSQAQTSALHIWKVTPVKKLSAARRSRRRRVAETMSDLFDLRALSAGGVKRVRFARRGSILLQKREIPQVVLETNLAGNSYVVNHLRIIVGSILLCEVAKG
ncbi:hypothetical protein PR048_021190 [Dryococelus australis]|uniref:Uncharacterized protein n=1 Tax=Dryococelus australis TaxID=614101 RepID=A0ABQ9GXL9_9NEOP|nr:hypothetical protein PR048_021190 [Dryococelus australis]